LFCGYATWRLFQPEAGTSHQRAANTHLDHDTIANLRQPFLKQLKGLFVQIVRWAKISGQHLQRQLSAGHATELDRIFLLQADLTHLEKPRAFTAVALFLL